jgi:hypothetical protein
MGKGHGCLPYASASFSQSRKDLCRGRRSLAAALAVAALAARCAAPQASGIQLVGNANRPLPRTAFSGIHGGICTSIRPAAGSAENPSPACGGTAPPPPPHAGHAAGGTFHSGTPPATTDWDTRMDNVEAGHSRIADLVRSLTALSAGGAAEKTTAVERSCASKTGAHSSNQIILLRSLHCLEVHWDGSQGPP